MKKLFSALLALFMLAAVFVGCGKNGDGQNTAEQGTTAINIEGDNLEERDYGGRVFKILSREDTVYEFEGDMVGTNVEQAVKFVEETGVDCLAVAVGTSHGAYKGTPHLEYDLLSTIAQSVDVPLVLHGGSGTGDDLIAKAIECGIQKVNLWTDLSQASNMAVKATIESDYAPDVDPNKKKINACQYDEIGAAAYKEALMHYMNVFGCTGKA